MSRIRTDDLVADIQRLSAELGRPPKAAEYDEQGEYSRSPIRRRFGSWNEALIRAGVGVGKEYRIADDRLLHDIREVAEEIDETPSGRQYRQYGNFGWETIRDRFGTWNEAVEKAGLEVKGSRGRLPAIAGMEPEDLGLSPIGVREGQP